MDHDDDDPSSPLLRSLTVDGYLRIDDFGLNTTALRIQALSALEQNGRPGPEGDKALIGSPGVKLPALEPLLSNRTLQRVISRYLGGRVRFEGYTLFTLTMYGFYQGVKLPRLSTQPLHDATRQTC